MLEASLLWEDGRADSPAVHRTTLWRRVKELGPLTASDWRNLGVLARTCPDSELSQERLALLCGWDVRTWRRRAERLVGSIWTQYRQLAGWEWLLEAALRRTGLVREPWFAKPGPRTPVRDNG